MNRRSQMAYQAMLESESEIVGRIHVTGLRSLNIMGILKRPVMAIWSRKR